MSNESKVLSAEMVALKLKDLEAGAYARLDVKQERYELSDHCSALRSQHDELLAMLERWQACFPLGLFFFPNDKKIEEETAALITRIKEE